LIARPYDAFGFHSTPAQFADPREALQLVKDMLCVENKYRLGQEYQDEYAKSEDSEWISSVTQMIQERVVREFTGRGSPKYWSSMDDGISFLRAAVGNFPESLEELKTCANYVRFTQCCRRGDLRVGDKLDCSDIPLYNPHNLSEMKPLSAYFDTPNRPLGLIASSYT